MNSKTHGKLGKCPHTCDFPAISPHGETAENPLLVGEIPKPLRHAKHDEEQLLRSWLRTLRALRA